MDRPIRIFLLIFFIVITNPLQGQYFQKWFAEGVMRIDLLFSGNAETNSYAFDALRIEPYYSGPRKQLLDPFDFGDHKFEVRDAASGTLIFRHTYCTLFREWLTTREADSVKRAFNHVLRFPWPKQPVVVEVFDRDRWGDFQLAWTGHFDPGSIYADPTNPLPFESVDLEIHGPPESKIDILFLAEGYAHDEMDKFIADVRRSADYIFSEEPFKSQRNEFNIRAVLSAGRDTGTDIPGQGIWKSTVLNSSFYTFGIERYLTTADFKSVCDVAANAHYDQLYILVNTDKYGGGGIYNFYSMSASDNIQSRAVVIHEFGHSFAGLADEYYTSAVAYNDFFPLDVEPWNPNLTTLVDFGAKWKGMIGRETPVPTPPDSVYRQSVGVFEGGGYVAKGVYRPMIDCRMHTNDAHFCPVCSKAINRVIRRQTGR